MSQKTLSTPGEIFEIERDDDTIIVVPTLDLRAMDYRRIEPEAIKILELLNGTSVKSVVLDFHKTDYYESTALSFFVKLWKRVESQRGRMAFCNITDHEKEILQIMHLDNLWPICSTRIEALEAVRK